MRRRVLVMSFSDLKRDPRVYRQIGFLLSAGSFDVVAFGDGDPELGSVSFVRAKRGRMRRVWQVLAALLLLARAHRLAYWSLPRVRSAVRALRKIRFDLIVANDIDTLPLALRLGGGCPVLFDAHEYYPSEYEDDWRWRLLFQRFHTWLCRRYLCKATVMSTVCEGIAKIYSAEFGVAPSVLLNLPEFQELEPSRVDPECIRMIYHGRAIPDRGIEQMIAMMDDLDERFQLDLMLVGARESYLSALKRLAIKSGRVAFVKPVPMLEIARATNHYDIGLFLYPCSSVNGRFVLPNKLFEYVQARLLCAIGPSPEMARMVSRYGFGLVSPDFTPRSLARLLRELQPGEIDSYKREAHKAAKQLCAQHSEKLFKVLVNEALDR